jgi:hypothetical protein
MTMAELGLKLDSRSLKSRCRIDIDKVRSHFRSADKKVTEIRSILREIKPCLIDYIQAATLFDVWIATAVKQLNDDSSDRSMKAVSDRFFSAIRFVDSHRIEGTASCWSELEAKCKSASSLVPAPPPGLSIEELKEKQVEMIALAVSRRDKCLSDLRTLQEELIIQFASQAAAIRTTAESISKNKTHYRNDLLVELDALGSRWRDERWAFKIILSALSLPHPDFCNQTDMMLFRMKQDSLFNAKKIFIVDVGSYSIKAGFAGSKAPHHILRSVAHLGGTNLLLGAEALRIPGEVTRAIYDGRIIAQEAMDYLWDNIFALVEGRAMIRTTSMTIESPILIATCPTMKQCHSDFLYESMLRKYRFPAFYIANQAVLSLFAAGKRTGLVVEMGYDCSYVVPVCEGAVIRDGTIIWPIGGDLLDHWFIKLWGLGGGIVNREEGFRLSEMRENVCYIALDFGQEIENYASDRQSGEIIVTGPDGQQFRRAEAKFRCPELFFQPALDGHNCDGLAQVVFNAIMRCDADIRNNLLSNIVISGGPSMTPGLAERLEKEVKKLAPSALTVQVIAPPGRRYGAWVGGSIFANEMFNDVSVMADDRSTIGNANLWPKIL